MKQNNSKVAVGNGTLLAEERGTRRSNMKTSVWNNGQFRNIQVSKGWIPSAERSKPRNKQKWSNLNMSLNIEEAQDVIEGLLKAIAYIQRHEAVSKAQSNTPSFSE